MPLKYIVHSLGLSLLVAIQPAYARSVRINDYCLNNPSCEQGETTILGTWMWDIDTNQLGSSKNADLWWNHINRNERELVPVNGAYIKRIGQGLCRAYGPHEIMQKDNFFTIDYYEKNRDSSLREERTIADGLPDLNKNTLINAGFTKEPIKELKPLAIFKEDTVFAVITNQGKLARLCVRGFRTNQEFYFREAYLLDKPTRLPGRGSENRYYHIKLDWTIFKGFDLMPYMESPE